MGERGVMGQPAEVDVRELGAGVVQITMQDRQHKNTFSPGLVHGLIRAFETVSVNPAYRAVVLTGYDTYFCSGGTREALAILHAGKGKFTDTRLYSLALECEIPVIAAMQGHGIGGGFVFGLFADVVVLSRESIYTTNFMKYGFTPGMGATCILPAKLGLGLAQEMLLSARTYRGDELGRRGAPFAVLPRADVLSHAREMAQEIADKPRVALVALKARLVEDLRERLPAVIEQEVVMHDTTFHRPEVGSRIERLFGR
jgi:polyketide biosynthesis enoyl-CoA hydratase PksI